MLPKHEINLYDVNDVYRNGDAADVYLCYKYFNSCMFFEIDRHCAPFQIDRELFISLLKRQIKLEAFYNEYLK